MANSNALDSVKKYVRAANYISAAQIYLQDNFLLKEKLEKEHIKPRLLGHWGTCPGSNFIYANLQHLINKHKTNTLFILGPGHGFASLQANLFIEGTLEKYYPKAKQNKEGIGYLIKNFSWPFGFPSHSNPGTPGVILEGGELGYALSTAYGAVLDNPDLLAACVIGDGEAETGPTAAAWHLHRFINPATSGAVLPILHLNGYKISGPTIFGRMSDKELTSLFKGYGYDPHIVEGDDDVIYEKMVSVMEESFQSIKNIQDEARRGHKDVLHEMPMIILKTPKGWTGIKSIHGEKIEGNHLSHQTVIPNAKEDSLELEALQEWLASYKFEELFDPQNGFIEEIKKLLPPEDLKMGANKHTFGGDAVCKPLRLPEVDKFAEDASAPGTIGSSSMRRSGLYLNEVFKLNDDRKNFRLFSPDETYSNKLDAVFETTPRAFMMPVEEWDKDLGTNGRVMEMLSEHSLQGLMQGYVLTGRHGVFASYEAFIQIIASMADQYAKFLKVSREFSWRGDIPSLNYILTSSGWRQEHNGFSHQNPGFIDGMLSKQGCFVKVYFPPDGNSTLAVLERVLSSKNEINVIVAGKTLGPRWLTPDLAKKELESGLMIWDFASDEYPDIVLSSVGDYLTKETLAAIDIVKNEAPEIKMRFVNILELSSFGFGNSGCSVPIVFEDYFTKDKPVIFNFHGYPQTLKKVLFDINAPQKISVHGYIENGSTTTPFDMQVRNETSRYHLAIEVFEMMAEEGKIDKEKSKELVNKFNQKLRDHRKYIEENGVDPEEIEKWQWTRTTS